MAEALPSTLVVAGDRVGPAMAGPSIRAWEIARALHARGGSVTLAAPGDIRLAAPFRCIGYDMRGDALRRAAAEASSVFVQGLTLAQYPFLASAATPLVVDLYDPFVLENLHARVSDTAAGRARAHGTDLAALEQQLLRGDFFVCASEVQRDFWLGCLTALGRVGPANYAADPTGRALLDVVPFGLPEEPPETVHEPVLRGVVPGIDGESKVLLWGGGIWDWFDPLTLIRAVGAAAKSRPELRLYFLGTRTPSLYRPRRSMADRATRLARELGLLDKVVFFNDGWVDYSRRHAYLSEAGIGVSTHLPHLETRYAFRTRLLDCIWAGLPMLVTRGDVLADLVESRRIGRAAPPNDVPALTAALLELLDALEDPAERAGMAKRLEAVRSEMTWHRAVEPLARFAHHPLVAPDRVEALAAGHGDGPHAAGGVSTMPATPPAGLPRRALEVLREGGPLLLAEEAVRYLRWLRRPR